jgi:hypothetical protein
MSIAPLPEPTSTHDFDTADGVRLLLRRYACTGSAQRVVLLLHGASACSHTFLRPGPPGRSGIADYLRANGCEVWTLDWRGSMLVALESNNGAMTLDAAATLDIPHAVMLVRRFGQLDEGQPLCIVAHCLGAAALSMAIAAQTLRDVPEKVVLSTVGLFYDVPWDGWVKAADQILERALITDPNLRFIHCDAGAHPWPANLEHAYQHWPERLLPARTLDERFRRTTFMFGRTFLEGVVAPEMLLGRELARQFGAIPLQMYIQAGQNVRRGFAAPYDDRSFDYARDQPRGGRRLDGATTGRYMHVEPFRRAEVTLLTGKLNGLWHPDSIRRMHDWLLRGGVRAHSHILDGYGHQDLYWGAHASQDVWPRVLHAIS